MTWDSMPERVKNRYRWESGTLYLNKSEISNYYIRPIKRLKTPAEKKEFLLIQYVIGQEEEMQEYILEITEPSKLKLPINMICMDYKRNSRSELITLLKMQMQDLSEYGWYIDSIGWHTVDNEWSYCAGNDLFLSKSDKDIYVDSKLAKQFQIKKGYDLDSENILKSVKELISLDSIPVNICLLYLVTGLLRSLFFAVNVPPQFVLYLYGKTQSYKTTTAKYFFDIYNKEDGKPFALENLTSSEAALQGKILEFRDCVFVLDDLSDGVSKAETMRKRNSANDFIRTAANCNPRRTKSGNDINGEAPECSIAITGEYLLDIESIVNRTVLVDMEKYELSRNILNFYTSNPLLPAMFSKIFLEWAVKNTGDILNNIKNSWRTYRNMENKSSISPRLSDSLCILHIACQIMFWCFKDYNVDMNMMTEKFRMAYVKIMKDEEAVLLSIRSKKENFNIAKEIAKLINCEKICVVSSIFGGNCYIKRGVLYIKPNYLCDVLSENVFKEKISVHRISSYLGENNLLILDKSKDFTKKSKNGERYYQIDVEKLSEAAGIEIEVTI